MNHINHHIHVDGSGKASVTTVNITTGLTLKPDFVLRVGDKVTFTTNREDTEIKYENVPGPTTKPGSPFSSQLQHSDRHRVSTGKVFTVETECSFPSHFHFLCGHNNPITRNFDRWGAQTGHQPGSGSPGPDE